MIGFQSLTAAASIAALAAAEFGVDQLGMEFHARPGSRPPGRPALCRGIRLRSDIVTCLNGLGCRRFYTDLPGWDRAIRRRIPPMTKGVVRNLLLRSTATARAARGA